ncbi:MAG: RodZ domain-containing protein [Pseudomonadota bacterium]
MREILHPGYGAQLAKAREDQGLSIAEVAAKLKLTTRQVEAMEAEDAAHLPGEVFLRGFVRNYARLVGLNPNDLVTTIDAEATVSATITAPSEGVAIGSGSLRKWLLIPLLGFILFVAIVALLYHWLRQGEVAFVPETVEQSAAATPGTAAEEPKNEVALPLDLPKAPAPGPSTDAALSAAATGPAASVPVEVPVAPARPNPAPSAPSPVLPPPAVAPVQEPPMEAVRPASPPAAESSARGTHVLRFTASQDAWIQVVDGKGKRFSKLVRAGGSDAISGEAPFRLVVGEAAQVTLSYDGRVIDLAPFIGQKVARLTLE